MNTKNKKIMWWWCDNCENKLAKVIRTNQSMPEILEIEGLHGEKFKVAFKFISVYCPKCGEENYIHAGFPLDQEWEKNVKDFPTDKDDLGWPIEFLLSPLKRNILLKRLNENQKDFVKFMLDRRGEWDFKSAGKELGLPEKIISKHLSVILDKIAEVEIEIMHKQMEKNEKDFHEWIMNKNSIRNSQQK